MATFKVSEKKDHCVVLFARDVDMAYVNLLRRFLMTDTQIYVFDHFHMKGTETDIPRDWIINRIKLLPVKGKGKCVLDVKNITKKDLSVTSDMITSPEGVKTEPGILITILKKGQSLDLEFDSVKAISGDYPAVTPFALTFEKAEDRTFAIKIEALSELFDANDIINSVKYANSRISNIARSLDKAL